ncbi:hypothetical protein [Brachybacterium conglomeratum]|uniref:hypothetical protein n=1 Tax=Brachybacterium conglomeratum TaxID=47846 RepID=UPI003DA18AAD
MDWAAPDTEEDSSLTVHSTTRSTPVDHPPTPGTALWVLAHPRQDSLNGLFFRAGTEALAERRSVSTSDLYAQGFDPLLGEQDLGRSAGRPGNLAQLAGEAYREGRADGAVRAEHE